MNVSKDIKITLNNEEHDSIQGVARIVKTFAEKNLCDLMSCYHCPLAIFCPLTDCVGDFEKTLNSIANMK